VLDPHGHILLTDPVFCTEDKPLQDRLSRSSIQKNATHIFIFHLKTEKQVKRLCTADIFGMECLQGLEMAVEGNGFSRSAACDI